VLLTTYPLISSYTHNGDDTLQRKNVQHILETTQNCGSNKNTMGKLHIIIKGTHTHEYSREFYVIDIRQKM